MCTLSIIIPCYNCEKTLEEAVNSCFVQGLDDFEIVMVDDGSTDGTKEVMQKLASNHLEIKLFYHEKNQGGGATRNTAVEHATSDIIFCLDSDDILPENTLSKMVAFMKEKRCDAVGIATSIKFSKNNIHHVVHRGEFINKGEKVMLNDLLERQGFCSLYSTFMMAKKAFVTAGGYPTEHGFDTQGFAWRFLGSGQLAYTSPEACYYHRVHFNKSYYLREYESGKANHNWLNILSENATMIGEEGVRFILNFDIHNEKSLFEEVKKEVKSLVPKRFSQSNESIDFLLQSGYDAFIHKRYEEALICVNKLALRYPNSLYIQYLKATSLQNLGLTLSPETLRMSRAFLDYKKRGAGLRFHQRVFKKMIKIIKDLL